jgi:membrane protein DedA with SNARE-associated domain
MGVEFVRPHLDFLASHLHVLVFGAFLVEAAGLPFPSRIVLLIAATLIDRTDALVGLVASSAAGAVIGDHVPYAAGKLMGPRLLTLYCRITLGSERCVEKTVAYFVRFGAAAIAFSRFSASVRIFAAVLSGCGHIRYRRFLVWDVLGSMTYAAAWASLGFLIGDEVGALLQRVGGARLLLLIGPVALLTLLAYRIWRRARYGRARVSGLADVSCAASPPAAPVGSGLRDAQRLAHHQ